MDFMITGTLVILGIFAATFSKILADEFKAWAPSFAEYILRSAATRLPAILRKRFSEEWQSDLIATPGDVGKIIFAMGCHVAAIRITHKSMSYIITKRLFDFCFGLLGILALSPILIVIMIVLRVESPDAVFFNDIRLGLNGKKFGIHRFRTMNALWGSSPETPETKSPITAAGAFLRRCGLDMLPMYFNVIKGDMSLVGPRPLRPSGDDNCLAREPERFSVKPGIVGWAQVSSFRAFSIHDNFESNQVADEKWYRENRSFWLDTKILLTALLIFVSKG